jgi:DHA2 family multidrug resistance protein
MQFPDIFYKWVPAWVKLSVLFIILLTSLTCNGVFLGNATDMYSGLGVYTEPFTEAYNAGFIGLGLGILIEIRLKRRFPNKILLIYGLTMMLLLNTVCMITSNPGIVVAACLLLGFSKAAAFFEIFIIWVQVWSKAFDRSRVYPSLYVIALGGSYFINWVTTRLAFAFDWRYAYIAVLLLILVCLLLALIFVENHPIRRIYPLYQMDWVGLLLLACILLLVNYIAVYGKVEDWFESTRISGACVLVPVTFFGFLRREMHVKRPLVPLRILKSFAFHKGLFFFLLLGIFLPSSIQSAFTGGLLRYEAIRNTELNLYLIPGLVVGAVLCYLWYYYRKDPDIMLFTGFLAFVLYYLLLYQKLSLGLGLEDFWSLSLLKGLGTIILYICIGLYTVSSYKPPDLLTAAGFMIITRSILGSGVFTGLYSYFIYSGTVRHMDRLADLTASADYVRNQTPAEYVRTITQQATLASFKELTGIILLIGVLILAIILISILYRGIVLKNRIFNQ